MLVGHFAAGLIAKRVEPKLSLGTCILAAMLPDLAWSVLLVAGVEQMHIQSGRGAANYLDTSEAALSQIAISNSLLMDVVWATLLAAAYFWRRRYPRGTFVLFAAVLSHWLLDFVSLYTPLAPGVHRALGLGLWHSVPGTLLVEGGLWLLGLTLYVPVAQPSNRVGIFAFWSVAVLFTLLWYGNIADPPPRDPRTAPIFSLIIFSLGVA